MPVESKKQFRFMKAVESGKIKKPGLTPEKAHEFIQESHMTKDKFKRLKEKISKRK